MAKPKKATRIEAPPAMRAIDGAVERTADLDRLIHENHEATLGGYPVCGALVTEIQVPVS